jgi:4-hydroxythreonine-4-phosphate dehydrogenase|tara:strand:- start:39 stop:962 length:924 start_codon:yes stop_codon:yes gene_type:complete
MKCKPIALTLGDYNGIGPKCIELALKNISLKNKKFYIIGDRDIFNKLNFPKSTSIELIDVKNKISFNPGKPTKMSGKASLNYIDEAIRLINNKKISGLVTGPISKEAIQKAGSLFKGHTDLLESKFHSENVIMAFWSKKIKVSLSTIHVPLVEVVDHLDSKKLFNQLQSIDKNFSKLLKKKPKIALCAINPHSSENGAIGNHDMKITYPAIKMARNKGIDVHGPFPADTLFIKKNIQAFDLFHAIYHDQGLIPFKMLSFDTGVNFTLNLPFIRTSPDHGTAFDIAWKKKPNSKSMVEAIRLALKLQI